MLKQLMTWFLRFVFRIRLNRVMQKYDGEKTLTIQELSARVKLLDPRLLEDYRPAKGMHFELWIGSYNAELLIQNIDQLSDAFANNGYVQEAGKTAFNRKMIRFDEFLVNNKNADVPIALFVSEFVRAVAELHRSHLIAAGDNIRRGYYQRKSEDFVYDLFDILEALEALALAETT